MVRWLNVQCPFIDRVVLKTNITKKFWLLPRSASMRRRRKRADNENNFIRRAHPRDIRGCREVDRIEMNLYFREANCSACPSFWTWRTLAFRWENWFSFSASPSRTTELIWSYCLLDCTEGSWRRSRRETLLHWRTERTLLPLEPPEVRSSTEKNDCSCFRVARTFPEIQYDLECLQDGFLVVFCIVECKTVIKIFIFKKMFNFRKCWIRHFGFNEFHKILTTHLDSTTWK